MVFKAKLNHERKSVFNLTRFLTYSSLQRPQAVSISETQIFRIMDSRHSDDFNLLLKNLYDTLLLASNSEWNGSIFHI